MVFLISCLALTQIGWINHLKLKNPIYSPLSAYGHFGRDGYEWEKTNMINEILGKI